MPQYQGHKNWNHWNVSLWISNDEGLYRMAKECIRSAGNLDKAARDMHALLNAYGKAKTPDGAPYSLSAIRAALRGL